MIDSLQVGVAVFVAPLIIAAVIRLICVIFGEDVRRDVGFAGRS